MHTPIPDPAEMQISDQHITIPRAALQGVVPPLQRRLHRLGHPATEAQVEAALWAWLIDHLDTQLTRVARLPVQAAHRDDFLAQLEAAQEHGLAVLTIA